MLQHNNDHTSTDAYLRELRSKKIILLEYYLKEGKLNKKGIITLHSNENKYQDIKDAKAILGKSNELKLTDDEVKLLSIIISGEIIEETLEDVNEQIREAMA